MFFPLREKPGVETGLLLNQRFDVLVFDIDIAILLIALATMQLFACIATAFVVTATFMK